MADEADVVDRWDRPQNSGAERMASFLKALQPLLSEPIATGKAARHHHTNTLTHIAPEPPDAVVWPTSTEEVSAIARLANHHRIPLVAFGAGTSLEGHVNAPLGGLTIDFSKMNRIVAVRPEDLDCTVEAGVTLAQLNAVLKPTGLFFPVDPGAEHATLGGMASTRASGTTTVRYGSMRDNVVSLTAVMADGTIVRTARRARKSSAGYDLTRLLIGAEGTLGLITELTLQLHGVPENIMAAVAGFPSIGAACNAAITAIQCGLHLARVELLDSVQIHCVNTRSRVGLAERPTLFLEFHGSATSCQEDFETFRTIAADNQGQDVRAASDDAGRRQLWRARHDAFWAVKSTYPGRQVLVTDVAVPLSRLAEAVTETAADILDNKLTAPIVGHVGDGNFHAILVLNHDDPEEEHRVGLFLDRLVARALAMDGTATGEHGIGEGKKQYLTREHGQAVGIMRQVKTALDPHNILNPNKIF
jgi:D-lactate dehydrogenase (cytochrome)